MMRIVFAALLASGMSLVPGVASAHYMGHGYGHSHRHCHGHHHRCHYHHHHSGHH